jgi:hypothetical protein
LANELRLFSYTLPQRHPEFYQRFEEVHIFAGPMRKKNDQNVIGFTYIQFFRKVNIVKKINIKPNLKVNFLAAAFLIFAFCCLDSCKSKPYYVKKVANKKASNFYVVCADPSHPGGWCSDLFSNYDDANSALAKHRKDTGHSDNSVENDCPFASQ